MRTNLRSMRARMTASFALFVALLMLIGGAVMLHREARRAEKRSREILAVARDRAGDELDEAKAEGQHESLLDLARTDTNELAAGGLVLVVVEAQEVVWRSRRYAPSWPQVGDDWRIQTLPHNGQTLVLAQNWKPIAADLQETARALWQLGALVVGATALAAWLVVGRTLSPLDQLAAQAQNASTEGLKVRLESPSSDAEMRYLTQTLNDLLARLEKETQVRGRFYAAASHELRTPIQVLLGQIDVARARPRSVPSHEEILAQLQSETERLATLVQDLLQLNALEMRQNQAPLELINLAFWVQRALSQQAEILEARALKVETHLDDLEIEAPSAHVEILLRNLLENAAKYATIGSRIQIETQTRQRETGHPLARLRVWNACQVPLGTQTEDWFEPFYRPDASRNSQTGGNGLGLSIVAALARTNGWLLQLHAQEHGVETLVTFPLSNSRSEFAASLNTDRE